MTNSNTNFTTQRVDVEHKILNNLVNTLIKYRCLLPHTLFNLSDGMFDNRIQFQFHTYLVKELKK